MKKLIMAYITVSMLMVSMPMVCIDNSPEAVLARNQTRAESYAQLARDEEMKAKWGEETAARWEQFQKEIRSIVAGGFGSKAQEAAKKIVLL